MFWSRLIIYVWDIGVPIENVSYCWIGFENIFQRREIHKSSFLGLERFSHSWLHKIKRRRLNKAFSYCRKNHFQVCCSRQNISICSPGNLRAAEWKCRIFTPRSQGTLDTRFCDEGFRFTLKCFWCESKKVYRERECKSHLTGRALSSQIREIMGGNCHDHRINVFHAAVPFFYFVHCCEFFMTNSWSGKSHFCQADAAVKLSILQISFHPTRYELFFLLRTVLN